MITISFGFCIMFRYNWTGKIWCQCHQRSTYSFYVCRSRKRKKIQLRHWYLFTLSGSASVKAVQRTLMKSTPDNNMITICGWFYWVPCHTRHFGTLYSIAIKRLKDIIIKRHFSSNIFFPVWIENIYFWTIMFHRCLWILEFV